MAEGIPRVFSDYGRIPLPCEAHAFISRVSSTPVILSVFSGCGHYRCDPSGRMVAAAVRGAMAAHPKEENLCLFSPLWEEGNENEKGQSSREPWGKLWLFT